MNKYKAKSVTISMDYPGAVISINHYKFKGRYTKKEARDWMDGLGWKIKQYHIEDWKQPIKVSISGVFKDKRSTPDLSNLTKVCLDALEEVSGVNDRNMRWHDGAITINKNVEPVIMITIQEAIDD